MAKNAITKAIHGELKYAFRGLESPRRSRGILSLSVKLTAPHTHIRRYEDPDVETEVECANCTLVYAVFGVFGYCPDCGQHNTLQILDRSFVTLEKTLIVLSRADDAEVAEHLLGNALEDLVSTFDGFGRELVRVHANARAQEGKPPQSFQNLKGADDAMAAAFGVRLSAALDDEEWKGLTTLYAKRHLIAHRMAVVNQKYLDTAEDPAAVLVHKRG